ncbi:MAG: hypothetical protein FWC70_09990 [Defluviitaleaceae bacterium]|nr:hypothetical protein [Defluviitaleaceae bacterium]
MITRKHLKVLVIFAVVSVSMLLGVVVVNANTVDPNNPGVTQDTAWAFNNTINITQPFTGLQNAHFYRLNVTVPEHRFHMVYNTPAGVQSRIRILNANGSERFDEAFGGGSHSFDVILGSGSFYIVVTNENHVSNVNYSLRAHPVDPPNVTRSPGGNRVEVVNGRLIVDGVNVQLHYLAQWRIPYHTVVNGVTISRYRSYAVSAEPISAINQPFFYNC